jgi:putative FmdB family regulatory protein
MPVYEYSCPGCGLKFELLRPMSRANEGAPCPDCNNGAERVPSTFAAFTKGASGDIAGVNGGGGCGSCSSSDCSSCHH